MPQVGPSGGPRWARGAPPGAEVLMKRVAVTGGSGKLGRAVVADLVAHGHEVVVLDRVPPADLPDGAASGVAGA